MRKNSDKNAYNAGTRLDELLSSFIDGELTADKQAEVEGLIAGDAKIAQRLRQLQTCQMLVASLPRAGAPARVLEGVRTSLAEKSTSDEWGTQKRHPRVRRVLAAAAMIGLAAVLVAVVHTIAPPAPTEQPFAVEGGRPSEATERPGGGFSVAAPHAFSGRLELKASDLVAVSASVNRAIEDINLSQAISPARRQDRRVYSLSCSREDLKSLLADLEHVWPELDSARLSVNTEVFGEQIVVDAVTTEQITQIVDQNDLGRCIEIAKDFAALNDMAALLPGRAIASAIEGQSKNLMHPLRVPKPALAEREDPTGRSPSQPEDKETVHLTIVVSW